MEPLTFAVIKFVLALIGIPLLTVSGVYFLARFTKTFDAYSEEKAKLLAQFHNLDRLIEQTNRLTTTTEAIKTRLSDEVWDRQMRWEYKRDLYVKIIGSITDMINAETLYLVYEATHRDTKSQAVAVETSVLQFHALLEVAPLVIPKHVMRALLEVAVKRNDTVFTKAGIDKMKEKLNLFRIEARNDLGYETAN